MRLIDADGIRKKAVPHTRGEYGYSADTRKWAVLVGDIDDAPTIYAIPVEDLRKVEHERDYWKELAISLQAIQNGRC